MPTCSCLLGETSNRDHSMHGKTNIYWALERERDEGGGGEDVNNMNVKMNEKATLCHVEKMST